MASIESNQIDTFQTDIFDEGAAEISNATSSFTPISDIQGAGHVSPLVGEAVETAGIVTAVAFNGFYLQDPVGDGDDETSDGIFVFTGGAPTVAVGDEVEVGGTVSEFIPGGAGTGNLSITQIASDTVSVVSSDNALPEAVIIGQSGRLQSNTTVISEDELPVNLQEAADDEANTFDPENDAIDFFESLEGQLVTIEDAVAVSPTRVFSAFSAEAFTVPNLGAVSDDPLNSRGGIPLASGADNTGDQNPERVQIQFDPTISGEGTPPALNVGDQLGDVTGVVGYSFGNFEVNVTEPVTVSTPGGLEQEVTSLVGTEDKLTVASYNVLNLTSTIAVEDDVTDPDATQRSLLAEQIVTNLGSPDIIALQEIQDNDGQNGGDNVPVSDATQTLQDLVDAIADAGGPTYEFFDVYADPGADETTIPQGGIPGGNIRNAFLYNPERVDLEGIEALTPSALTDAGVSNPDAFAGTRIPLVGTFSFNDETISVVNNHLTSRFGSTPVFGGPQPFVQAGEAEREAQTLALNEYVDSVLATDENANIVVAGDLNTFEFTDDLAEILPGTGDEQVLTNLISQAEADGDAYTFIFDGNSQVLDHAFVTDSLLDSAEFDVVHVNNDFTRDDNAIVFSDVLSASDHEPIVASFDFSEGSVIDFEGFASGTVVTDQFEGATFSTLSEFGVMVFDTANVTGADDDLASDTLGNVLIISEDGDSSDADDAAQGGTINVVFDELTTVNSVSFLDIEETGGSITFLGVDSTIIETVEIPALDDNSFQTLAVSTESVSAMEIVFAGSGAIAEIDFTPVEVIA
ncbi:MAG: endonuclease/exonuclease/phosphatase family protein [Cyanobacteria bacterium J06627_8]